jgi:hypothetical protein
MSMKFDLHKMSLPAPEDDWMCRADVARMLGVSDRTAQTLERRGEFKAIEHGNFGRLRRKYSRCLLQRELARRWDEALRRQSGPTDQPVAPVEEFQHVDLTLAVPGALPTQGDLR